MRRRNTLIGRRVGARRCLVHAPIRTDGRGEGGNNRRRRRSAPRQARIRVFCWRASARPCVGRVLVGRAHSTRSRASEIPGSGRSQTKYSIFRRPPPQYSNSAYSIAHQCMCVCVCRVCVCVCSMRRQCLAQRLALTLLLPFVCHDACMSQPGTSRIEPIRFGSPPCATQAPRSSGV